MNKFKINRTYVGKDCKTYFIADIAANHDGSLKRAKKLIQLAAKSGANAAKFQNFKAETIVSNKMFLSLKNKLSHQSKWKNSVFKVYKKAETPIYWTNELKETCYKFGIDYFTAPYDLNFISYLKKFVSAWKVGSGDITWHEIIMEMAENNKPIIIATGASNLEEVKIIMNSLEALGYKKCIMYDNFGYLFEIVDLNNIESLFFKYLYTKSETFYYFDILIPNTKFQDSILNEEVQYFCDVAGVTTKPFD